MLKPRSEQMLFSIKTHTKHISKFYNTAKKGEEWENAFSKREEFLIGDGWWIGSLFFLATEFECDRAEEDEEVLENKR